MSVGITLKRLRSKTKYSQQDMADMLNIDRLTYINWENEATEVKSSYIPKLAGIFGVKIEGLFEASANTIISVSDTASSGSSNNDIIIKFSDPETAEKVSRQIQELIKAIKQ
jgi:transcriptional regulator with XRE-family HTH domain